jgi:hypothetical protein
MPPGVTASVGVSGTIGVVPSAIVVSPLEQISTIFDNMARLGDLPINPRAR